jgi:hypothetical protein
MQAIHGTTEPRRKGEAGALCTTKGLPQYDPSLAAKRPPDFALAHKVRRHPLTSVFYEMRKNLPRCQKTIQSSK